MWRRRAPGQAEGQRRAEAQHDGAPGGPAAPPGQRRHHEQQDGRQRGQLEHHRQRDHHGQHHDDAVALPGFRRAAAEVGQPQGEMEGIQDRQRARDVAVGRADPHPQDQQRREQRQRDEQDAEQR
jgi:hypothetical protein